MYDQAYLGDPVRYSPMQHWGDGDLYNDTDEKEERKRIRKLWDAEQRRVQLSVAQDLFVIKHSSLRFGMRIQGHYVKILEVGRSLGVSSSPRNQQEAQRTSFYVWWPALLFLQHLTTKASRVNLLQYKQWPLRELPCLLQGGAVHHRYTCGHGTVPQKCLHPSTVLWNDFYILKTHGTPWRKASIATFNICHKHAIQCGWLYVAANVCYKL